MISAEDKTMHKGIETGTLLACATFKSMAFGGSWDCIG